LFTRYLRAHLAQRPGQPVAILDAGYTTAWDLRVTGWDLGAMKLAAADGDPTVGDPEDRGSGDTGVTVNLIDDDQPVTRQAAGADALGGTCVLGDLRTVPLSPRAFDIVQCLSLLERIEHAELVLDRLVNALKPGGLLLLGIRDRDSAAGFLDRVLPAALRRVVWRRRRPGQPGPYPAVYERLASARGIQAYAVLRGLVVAERLAVGGLAGGLPPGPPGYLAAQKLVAWLSRGRLPAAHEELLYVLRKPENRFARVL
jgi:SAM-dependent methyltransferase